MGEKRMKTSVITRIFVPKKLYINDIKKHALTTPKIEVCGMLTGSIQDGISFPATYYPIKNVAPSGGVADYLMDPVEYGRVLLNTSIVRPKSDIDLTAVFHTHPNHEPAPSTIDYARAEWKTVYLILNPNKPELGMQAYYWNGKDFHHIKLEYTV
jgi:proteasome lid subunit RPN8/RPN11